MKAMNKGFTLVEVMIVVAIIGILATIAIPSYTDHVRRGAIPEGLAALADGRVKMEQRFMDTRGYTAQCTALNGTTAGRFAIACTATDPNPGATPPTPGSYTLTATGAGIVAGFIYTINQGNVKQTTGVHAAWTGVTPPVNCWVRKRDGSC